MSVETPDAMRFGLRNPKTGHFYTSNEMVNRKPDFIPCPFTFISREQAERTLICYHIARLCKEYGWGRAPKKLELCKIESDEVAITKLSFEDDPVILAEIVARFRAKYTSLCGGLDGSFSAERCLIKGLRCSVHKHGYRFLAAFATPHSSLINVSWPQVRMEYDLDDNFWYPSEISSSVIFTDLGDIVMLKMRDVLPRFIYDLYDEKFIDCGAR